MKLIYSFLFLFLFFNAFAQENKSAITPKKQIILFNGKDLTGWEGKESIWKVENGVIIGGNKSTSQPQNEFLCTSSAYQNYELELKFKLNGYSGFINAGVQFHSERSVNPANEMIGFQADIGPDCMGSLYDESRRDKYLIKADQQKVKIKDGWNTYRIRCEKNFITLCINNKQTISYTETDSSISLLGKIGLQIHGGGVLEISYKDIVLKPLN